MTRSTTGASVARFRDFGNCRESASLNLTFDRALRHEETRADQRFITRPIVARGVTVFAYRIQQRVARQLNTLFRFNAELLA
jgi:hypothetical protein